MKAHIKTITFVQHVQNGCHRPWLFGRIGVHAAMGLWEQRNIVSVLLN